MSYNHADDRAVLDRLKKRQEQRYRRYKKRPGDEWKQHQPRWPYDCARCKFSWSCGELCACNVKKGKTPPKRQAEVDTLLATWRRGLLRRKRVEKLDDKVEQHVKDNSGCTPTEIQRALKKAPGTVQGSLSRLEREGRVKRDIARGTVKPGKKNP
jgi:hypothetical protein